LACSRNINNEAVLKIGIFNIDSGIPGPTDTVAGTFMCSFPMGRFMCLRIFPRGNILAAVYLCGYVTIDFKEFPDGSWIGNFTEEV